MQKGYFHDNARDNRFLLKNFYYLVKPRVAAEPSQCEKKGGERKGLSLPKIGRRRPRSLGERRQQRFPENRMFQEIQKKFGMMEQLRKGGMTECRTST